MEEQGRIVHWSGLNNENKEIKFKNTNNRKSKILYLTVQWLKLTFSEVKRKIKFIN